MTVITSYAFDPNEVEQMQVTIFVTMSLQHWRIAKHDLDEAARALPSERVLNEIRRAIRAIEKAAGTGPDGAVRVDSAEQETGT